MRVVRMVLLAVGVVCLVRSPARAEEAGDALKQVYPRAYFDPYNPQTARDIVDRIPGFTFDAGDDLRGFGGAAGNVLVDGVRPTSKTGGIEDALTRIPAIDVERVEVIRGAAGTSEATGQTVVANIIRTTRALSASWRAELERNGDGLIYPFFEGALIARPGNWTTSTKLTGFWEQFPLEGRRDRFDENGNLTLAQEESRPSILTQGFLSTEAIRPFAGGTLTINARGGISSFIPITERSQFDAREPDGSPDGFARIEFDSIEWTAEGSVDWTRTFRNGWTFKTILLASSRPLDEETLIFRNRPVGVLSSGSRFTNRQIPFEGIFRTTYSRGGESSLKPEFGIEAAYNRLDSEFAFFERDADLNETPVDLPGSDVVVDEPRGEAFANLIWLATPSLTLETGFAIEASRISVSGEAENTRSFVFAKPFANFLYRPFSSLQLRLGMRRSVGQLDFGDFAASAQGEQDRQFAGNAELGPDQVWRGAFAIDWREESTGALNLELFHEWRSDVLEQLTLPAGGFGLANAGDGRLWGLTVSGSLQLRPVIPGGLLEVRATVQDSTFDDPLTGQARALTGIPTPIVTANFRQDFPAIRTSWGVNYRAIQDTRFFFGNEIADSRNGTEIGTFVETTHFFDVKARLTLTGISGRRFQTDRTFFTPDRSGALAGSERVDRERGMFITLSVEGQSTFGTDEDRDT